MPSAVLTGALEPLSQSGLRGTEEQGGLQREEGGSQARPPTTHRQGSACVFTVFNITIKLRSLWHFKCFQINLYSNVVMRKWLLSKG